MASVWALLVAAGAFTLLLGLVVDGGNAIDARLEAKRAAEQAARAGADALAAGGVRSGTDSLDADEAAARARAVLARAGWHGTVAVAGTEVRVSVDGRSPNEFLGVIGVSFFRVHESGTATAITGPPGRAG